MQRDARRLYCESQFLSDTCCHIPPGISLLAGTIFARTITPASKLCQTLQTSGVGQNVGCWVLGVSCWVESRLQTAVCRLRTKSIALNPQSEIHSRKSEIESLHPTPYAQHP